MSDREEEKSEWNGDEILIPLDDLDLEDDEKDYGNSPLIPIGNFSNYNAMICPKCGREYGHDDSLFCTEDGTKLYEIWKCRHCDEDLTKAQGYSEINVCPNCGKALDAMQKKSINSTKSGEPYELKRICTHEKCGSPVVSMQCSCGEIFHQMEDGSFDKYCPKCGNLNPVEQEKQNVAAELKRKQEEAERQKREAERRQKEADHFAWIKSLKVGDKITFGSYPFYEDGREKPIDWIILDKDADRNALVISDYCLDNVRYNEKSESVIWETSSIRKWLNNEFYNRAFNKKEKGLILKNNRVYVKKGLIFDSQEVAVDKLFLLSIDEARKYFKDSKSRIAYPTPYAKSKKSVNGNLLVSIDYVSTDRGGSCWWWLRSPGYGQDNAAYVNHAGGDVYSSGYCVSCVSNAVRVALKINLNNL